MVMSPEEWLASQQKQPAAMSPEQWLASQQPVQPQVPAVQRPVQPVPAEKPEERGFLEKAAGVGEAALTIGTSALAEPVAGIWGLLSSGYEEAFGKGEGLEAGVKAIEGAKEALTYQPRGEVGKEYLQDIGETVQPVVEPVSKAIKAASDYAYDVTGSPAIATAVGTSPVLLAEILGLSAIRKVRKGATLIDDVGQPTNVLRKALDKEGLVYENLSDAAKKAIPKNADPKLLPSPKAEVSGAAEKALVEQLKSGAKDDALATLKLVNGKVKPDKLGHEAVRQGFQPGFVQSVKTATPQTRKAMNKMLSTMEQITKNQSLIAKGVRPTNIVGDEVMKRVSFIKDKAGKARLELNRIAENELRGKPLPDADINNVTNKLYDSLAKLDVGVDDSIGGAPKLNYAGSMISKDRTSQRIINDLVGLMAEGKRPDAMRLHKLKKQLDTMIDFRKKSAGGLTDAGKNVLKDVRYELNQTLRNSSPNYAKTNDVLSSSITAMDDFKRAVGPSIDIFAEGAEKAIGTDLRGLLSNRKSRIKLDNSLNQLDEVANNLGGRFKVDYKDLSLFANGIEDRFGAVAKTSFKGDIESAIRTTQEAAERGAAATVTKMGIDKATEMADKMRGINDFNAFKSMRDLIKGAE